MMKFRIISKCVRTLPAGDALERIWAKEQGPYAPELIQYLETNEQNYDSILFVTYLYYLTIAGLPKVAAKSILIPTAHDEPYIYFSIYKKIFTMPRAIIYLTDEKKKFVQSLFHNEKIPSIVAGMRIEVPDKTDPDQFREKYRITGKYLLYLGRIDIGKNCPQMFEFFQKYKRENPGELKLVLVGKPVMELPQDKDIISVGFIEESEKYDAISGACALWMPSEYESLSIVVLEAMALGIPIIVNGKCEVLKAHCVKSKSGIYYTGYESFKSEVDKEILKLINKVKADEKRIVNNRAIEYVKENYSWQILLEKYRELLS